MPKVRRAKPVSQQLKDRFGSRTSARNAARNKGHSDNGQGADSMVRVTATGSPQIERSKSRTFVRVAYSTSASCPNSLPRTDKDGGWRLDGTKLAYVDPSYH
jgi:hypothetical protein